MKFGLRKVDKSLNIYQNEFNFLDIGCGNQGASKTKAVFPDCNYYGLDISKDYNISDEDFKKMTEFYEIDLTTLDFKIIPNNFFDIIYMSHIIEHLYNGEKVIIKLIKKLKENGILYIEYPSIRSTKFPSMRGTLNFFDDKSHIRLYSLKNLCILLEKNKIKIIKCGTRRSIRLILLTPIFLMFDLLSNKSPSADTFWDLFGFAEYIIARK